MDTSILSNQETETNSTLDVSEQSHEALITENTALKNELISLKNKLDISQKKNEILSTMNQDYTSKYKEIVSQNKFSKTEESQTETTDLQIKDLQRILDTLKDYNQQLNNTNIDYMKQIHLLTTQIAKDQAIHMTLQHQNSKNEAELDRVYNKLINAKLTINERNSVINELQRKLELQTPNTIQSNKSVERSVCSLKQSHTNNSERDRAYDTKLCLNHFDNDAKAYQIWMESCDKDNEAQAHYNSLYPLLCTLFMERTNSKRVPTLIDLKEVIMTDKSDVIHYQMFVKFWNWFKECCLIIKELYYLWDNVGYVVQCNLFCRREGCEQILDKAPNGTFIIRLSSTIKGGIVLSYFERSSIKKGKLFKHTLLIRKQPHKYQIQMKNTEKYNENKRSPLVTIPSLIKSFVKIKFLYSPNGIYQKCAVF